MNQEDPIHLPAREPLRPEVRRVETPPALGNVLEVIEPQPVAPPKFTPRYPWLPLILFLFTCLTTWFSGAGLFGLWGGVQYSICVLAILGAHEMGHYLQSRRYHVPASLPMFIPMPLTPIGTMGAVIFQQPGVAGRRAMFDIAISGPLAGLVFALPILWYGLVNARVETFSPDVKAIIFSDPLLIKLLTRLIHGPLGEHQDLMLNPFLFAGWVGVFITALNMFPLGQLDGGHILYTLLGRRSYPIVRLLFLTLVVLVIVGSLTTDSGYMGWALMLFLVWKTGIAHPPTSDDTQPLGWFRKILGWVTLTFVFWGFIPRPIYEKDGTSPPPGKKPAAQEVLDSASVGDRWLQRKS